MATYIRLTDYKSSDEKEQEFFNPENRYEAKQEDFSKIPASPIAYWISEKVRNVFNMDNIKKYGATRKGMVTADNPRFIRGWFEVSRNKINFYAKSREEAIESKLKWFPYQRGGESRKWYGLNNDIVIWFNDGNELLNMKGKGYKVGSTNHNLEYIFNPVICWNKISMSNLTARTVNYGYLCDDAAPFLSLNNIDHTLYFLGLLNSHIAMKYNNIMNQTMNFSPGTISNIPLILSDNSSIDNIVQQNIDISKEEWDSRETSWDFQANPLLEMLNVECSMFNVENNSKFKIQNLTLEMVYNHYCEYWKEKFFILHKNEEELNRLFIDIYELQDELTPDVELKDITILKNEAKIVDRELVFQADEIMKQLISYGVGVMFGRYSLDHKGLHVANMNESLDEANLKFNIENPTFEADDDNIIPVLEDDYFKDDIASRFIQFVKTTFGEKNLIENIHFIEDALGTTIRKYFVKYFYPDHIKRYKKRPIYWMVSSPKKGFNALIYMHRYKSDTFARVRNSYLTEYIAKLEAHKETLALTIRSSTASNKDKKDADKAIKNIEIKLKEIIAFDRDAMMHYAQNNEEIDLDDGVKVNYCKFKDILYPIKGLCKSK